METKCQICGKIFNKPPSVIKNGKGIYCSKNCKYKGLSQRYKGRPGIPRFGDENPNWRGKNVEKSCPICNKIFKSINKTCSKQCGHKLQGKRITKEGNGNWISQEFYLFKNYRMLLTLSHCDVCKSTRRIIAHHRNGDRLDNRIENLIALCYSCHTTVHALNKKTTNQKLLELATELTRASS